MNRGMSVIVPFLNEEDGVKLFCEEFDKYVGTLDFIIEVVFVNDGSTDASLQRLQECAFHYISGKVTVGWNYSLLVDN